MAVNRSRMRVLALTAVTVLGLAVPPLVSASAGEREQSSAFLQCQGTETVTYRPGVTLQPRNIDVTTDGRFPSCVDAAGQVTSGSYAEHFTLFAGCNDLLGNFTARRTFKWNTGDTSVAEITGSSTAAAGQVVTTITGKVVEGRFEGRTVAEVIALPQTGLLQCLGTGLTGTTGVTTLTVT
jgi:hypothetical protein